MPGASSKISGLIASGQMNFVKKVHTTSHHSVQRWSDGRVVPLFRIVLEVWFLQYLGCNLKHQNSRLRGPPINLWFITNPDGIDKWHYYGTRLLAEFNV